MLRCLIPSLCCFVFHLIGYSQTKIYISDAGNFNKPPWQILVADSISATPRIFTKEEMAWPQDILFVEDSNWVLISQLNSGCINIHHAETGKYLKPFATGIAGPTRMKIGPDGLLYVLQWKGKGEVLRFTLDGNKEASWVDTALTTCIGLAWDEAENLYVSSFKGKVVAKFDKVGNPMGNTVTDSLQGPTNIWFNEKSELVVVDYNGRAIKVFDSKGNFLRTWITGLHQPEGIDFLPNGRMLIGNGGTASVKLYTAEGKYLKEVVKSGAGGLIRPNAVRVR